MLNNSSRIARYARAYWGRATVIAFVVLLFVSAVFDRSPGRTSDADELIIGMQLEPPNLDPTIGAAGAVDSVVYANVFEGLTRIDEGGDVVPSLARAWQVLDGGLRYRFFLTQGAVFHNGVPFDASIVAFSLSRATASGSANVQQALLREITSIEIINPYAVDIVLERPFSNLLRVLAWGDAVMVEPSTVDTNSVHPVGTGPYRFVKWRRGADIWLARSENYHGDEPQFNDVRFRFVSDPATAFNAVLAGDIDLFAGYPAPENFSKLSKISQLRTISGLSEGETLLAINHRHAALKMRGVRRALNHAINKRDVLEGAMFGYGAEIGSHFSPNAEYYQNLSDYYPYDPQFARQLLKEAGYENTLRLRLMLPPPVYARRSGEIVASQLRAVGIDVDIQLVEWAQWIDQVFLRHDFDLTIVAHTEPDDIDIYTRADYYFGYSNEHFNGLIETYLHSSNAQERATAISDAQVLLAEDAVNVFLYQLPNLTVAKRNLQGIWTNAPIQAIDVTKVRAQ